MTKSEFEQLIQDAGLNLHLSYMCRFVVSLRVGGRIQCCTLVPDPEKSEDETREYVADKKSELEDASKTQQGRMAEERPQKAQKKPVQKKQPTAQTISTIAYPAH